MNLIQESIFDNDSMTVDIDTVDRCLKTFYHLKVFVSLIP
jgi:hypothetical protein